MKKVIICLFAILFLTGCGIGGSSNDGIEAISKVKFGDNVIKLFSTVKDAGLDLNKSHSENPNNFNDMTFAIYPNVNTLEVKNGYKWRAEDLNDNLKISLRGVNNTGKSVIIDDVEIEEIIVEKYNYTESQTENVDAIVLDSIIVNKSSYSDVMNELSKYEKAAINESSTRISVKMYDGEDEFSSENKIEGIFEFENDILIRFTVQRSAY